jgi:succinate dehydrogenase / fumarate reductase cytochrome b subunit
VLSAGMLLLALVPVAAACGPEVYAPLHAFLSSLVGRVSLWLWIFSFMFHLCHGIRHILWDVGVGYEKLALNRYAVLEVTAALLITVTAWIVTSNLND